MSYSSYPKVILPVKRNIQDNNYDCGPASALIILQSIGIDANEAKLMEIGNCTREKGTSPEGIKMIFDYYKIEYEELLNASLDDLENNINNLKLCLVDYQAWTIGNEKATLNAGHYSVIFGFSPHYLWIADPYKHHTAKYDKWGARKMRKDLFVKDWLDTEDNIKINKHWMIAVPLSQMRI